MSGPLRDFIHLIRLAAVFAVGITAFLAWRAWMIPADFGVYGHYRASALVDARARQPVYAGQAACADCHADVVEVRLGAGHAAVSCESCHGALSAHAAGAEEPKPVRPAGRTTCLPCHAARAGKPSGFPQVVVAEHAPTGPCSECHRPHRPRVE